MIIYPYKLNQKELDFHTNPNYHFNVTQHWHRSLEIICTKESEGYLTVNGNRIFLPKNTFYIINSTDSHFLEPKDHSAPCYGYALLIDYQFLVNHWPNIDDYYFIVGDQQKIFLNTLTELIITLYFEDRLKNQENIYHLLYSFVEYLIHHCVGLTVSNKKISSEKLISIVTFLEERYNQEIDLNLVAEKFGISYNYLAKMFKKHLNTSAGEYLNEIRFEKAFNDVATTRDSITDIAYRHGYANSSAFIKRFKEIKGVTPKKYRTMLEG